MTLNVACVSGSCIASLVLAGLCGILQAKNTNILCWKCRTNGDTAIPSQTATTDQTIDSKANPAAVPFTTTADTRDRNDTDESVYVPETTADTRDRNDTDESVYLPETTADTRERNYTIESADVPETTGVIASAISGGLVVAVVVVVTFILCIRRRTAQQHAQTETNVQHDANDKEATRHSDENSVHVYDYTDVVSYDKPDGDVTNATASDGVMYDDATTTGLYVGLIPSDTEKQYSVLFQKQKEST